MLRLFLQRFALTFCLTPLIACASTVPATEARDPRDAQLQACLSGHLPAAEAARISRETWHRHMPSLRGDYSVLERLDFQPEFRTPLWDYLAGLVDDERIEQGQQRLQQHAELLDRIESAYGVPREIVVSVWGVESNYGQNQGRVAILPALATLSCFGRRQPFFRGELFAVLRLLQQGDIPVEQLRGSWAGAFGQTQFMPTTFERLAVDFDGDGRRDLINSIPDALASTAHFLRRSGWQTGRPWGIEVSLPAGFVLEGEGRRQKRELQTWTSRGVRAVDGRPLSSALGLPGDTPAGLVAPVGPQGPAFITLRNFDALFSYNAAESYALALGHLADRLRGGGPLVTPWPTDDPPLSRAQRRELQTLLLARGHDIGEVDGILGSRSRQAIQQEQARLGHEASGRGGLKLLQALQSSR